MAPTLEEFSGLNIGRLYIDGRWTAPGDNGFEPIINPATEQLLADVPNGGAAECDAALAAARRAFDEGPWAHEDRMVRVKLMERLFERVAARMAGVHRLMILEMGYTAGECAGMMNLGMALFERFLEHARRDPITPLPIVVSANRGGGRTLGGAIKVRQPIGVVSAITPYNAGFFLGLIKCVPAMLAGNSVILKPAPLTPLQSFLLADFMSELDLPPGTFNLVTGGIETGIALTSDPRVDMVSFTGSDAVGTAVMAQGAPTLKKVHLELGGKSALIVRADADIDRAIQSGLVAFVQCGQGCALVTRHLVHNSIRAEFVGRLATAAAAMKVGDPSSIDTRVGPLIRESARARTERFVETAQAEGATLVQGGRRPPHLDRGFFYEPTIFDDVAPGSNLAQKEVFGPIVAVIGFDDDAEAIAIANHSDFGLSGGIYTADTGTALDMALRIRTGTVQINGGPGGPHPDMPFGGFKRSGLGREWGEEGYNEFTELQSIGFHAA